ncbi:hypothetical protein M23134_06998 [Microscilla marina ATCC 23134]|uniref:Uncharacterized protein n=1 Tax=Microscilla marina ATCC 23134 TaxID=313606 RepID=A1ZT14_MICM2|nr:hypothetical protein M23134_06998 [Microscilla marina ATCC 23134]
MAKVILSKLKKQDLNPENGRKNSEQNTMLFAQNKTPIKRILYEGKMGN